jgi:rhamnosyltransferase
MKVAILGSRGIPAKYGGFETFAEGLTQNLINKGFELTVSCEYEDPVTRVNDLNGIKLEYFPVKPPNNYFLRKIYENLSDIFFLLRLSKQSEVIIFLGIEVGMFLFIPQLLNKRVKTLVNIDGVMWERTKFNKFERWLLKINHIMAIKFADVVIADSKEMMSYVEDKYHDKTTYLSYGIQTPEQIPWNGKNLKKLTKYTGKPLVPGNYFLVVARLEPENNILTIIEGFVKSDLKTPMVVLGDFTSKEYQKQIENIAGSMGSNEIYFLGSIYDEELLNMLRQNCLAYIHGHSVGGTNPSLLEAAISKNIILAHNNAFNREVCRENAIYFNNSNELKFQLELVDKNPEKYSKIKINVHNSVKDEYSWEKISNGYENLLNSVGNNVGK